MVITPAQCRAARGLLGWSQRDLAAKAKVSRRTILTFEDERSTPFDRTLADIAKALEEAGVVFISESGDGLQATAALKHGVRPKVRHTKENSSEEVSDGEEEKQEMLRFFSEHPNVWPRLSEEAREELSVRMGTGMGEDLFGGVDSLGAAQAGL